MIQRVPNKMDKIKGDTFVDVYLLGSIKSFNIRVDHRDKKSLNVIKKNIEVKLPSIQNATETLDVEPVDEKKIKDNEKSEKFEIDDPW